MAQHPGGRARVCRDRRIWKKSDQDQADRMPSSPDAQCQYVAERTSTKLRRQLTSDDRELEALKVYADGPCEDTVVRYTPAP
ncbi:hypothetical protein OG402_02625 [Streptomyces anulatus]|nr:hypothetical protein [Streptomyces sp. W007]MCX4516565.1 hypothetical protein [Streptomyces anulatus]EHM24346.1 hypothetical protein SPW_7285 [Streptomyces sp. W007]MCX4599393.1 hypothetical protein [Streptomyces anulatus]WSU71921.1 hypothetical protein OG499_02735 [Streptomyces anulatus]WTD29710.1 hypothetical protein OH737_36590 [Streptomyces anulatus]